MQHALLAGLIGAVLPLLLPAAASPKIQVDPNGPAGYEYAVPLDRARAQNADGGSAGVPGSTARPPLYGQGIAPADDATGGSGAAQGQGALPGTGTSADGEGGEVQVAGLALAVLLAAAGVSFAVRRTARRAPKG